MKTTRKLLTIVLILALLLVGCKSEPLVIQESETCIAIRVPEGTADMTLLAFMEQLAGEGKLTCKISDGMITSINGIDNPADFSSCWMLYTSDAENANTAWGTVQFDGETYGSAISGAEVLKIKTGQLYIWVFQSFS